MDTNTTPTPAPSGSTDKKRGFLTGNIYMLVATLLFAANIPVVKLLIPEWFKAEDITLLRLVGGAALFWILAVILRRKEKLTRRDFLTLFIGGGVTLFVFIYLLNVALRFGNPIDVAILMALSPAYVIAYQIVFKHQRPSWQEIVGVIAAFAGAVVVILCGKESAKASDPVLGDILAIVSGIAYMAYLLIVEKPSKEYHPVTVLKWVFLGSAIPCVLLITTFVHSPIWESDSSTLGPWLWVAFDVAGPSFLAYLLLNPALKRIGSELVSLWEYLLPVFAAIMAVMMHEARFEWFEGVAVAVIIGGMLLTNIGKRRRG